MVGMSLDLCRGMAVVVDDAIGEEEQIDGIIGRIKDSGIPVCEFRTLDDAEKSLDNLLMVNFVVLDWNLREGPSEDEPLLPGSELREAMIRRVVDFIRKLKEVCFAPVFIFTMEASEDIEDQIIDRLRKEGLYFDEKSNFIYVRNKIDILKGNRLLQDIVKWIENHPPVYLLKSWQTKFLQAQNEVSWELHNTSPGWPCILWNNFKEDGQDPQCSISDTLFRLVMSRVQPMGLDSRKVTAIRDFENEDLIRVFKGIMYLDTGLLGIKPGDIFKKGRKYYMNIRPECDTTTREKNSDETLVYLVKGSSINRNALRKRHTDTGFVPWRTETLLFFVEGAKALKFSFKDFYIERFGDWSPYRICRLLPPFITEVQQRFSSFVGRYGVPRLPVEIENEILGLSNQS